MKTKLIFVCFGATFYFTSCTNEPTSQFTDISSTNYQIDVLTRSAIDSVMDSFEQCHYNEIDESYHQYSDPGYEFKSSLRTRNYCIIHKHDFDKKIVGKFVVRDFITHDEYYRSALRNDSVSELYWLIDRNVLYMMLELIQEVDKLGHNMYGFEIRNGHRHPRKNKEVKGASRSQHIYGKAIDIAVMDVNEDGQATQKDKTILYGLLEEIVGSRGGLGRYPGTMSLHFDCRGRKARWDSY